VMLKLCINVSASHLWHEQRASLCVSIGDFHFAANGGNGWSQMELAVYLKFFINVSASHFFPV